MPSFGSSRAVWVWSAGFALAALVHTSVSAKVINTYRYWEGPYYYVNEVGCPVSDTTFGQVITAPKGSSTLSEFSFWWASAEWSRGGSMVIRGEVYAWDGTKATGNPLYESKKRKIAYQDFDFHKATLRPNGIPVMPGAQYVIFASIDKDYDKCMDNYQIVWAAVADTLYPKGTFVHQDNSGDESRWTTEAWRATTGVDLAFKAYFSP